MKAAQIMTFKEPLSISDVPISPNLVAGDILIKVECCGVCHTDIHLQNGDLPCALPLIPGHEVIGHVVAVGDNETTFVVGDRVGVPFLHDACGSCEDCWEGCETACDKKSCTGFTVSGGLAEFIKAKSHYCCRIPDGLPSVQAAPILCAGVTAYKALKQSNVKPGQYLVIVGAGGGLGHMALQYAKAMGMIVIAIDHKDATLKMLKELKADHILDFTKVDTKTEILKITRGKGCHGCILLAESAKPFTDAIEYVRSRGTIVCLSLSPVAYPLPLVALVTKQINVKGSLVGTRLDLHEAMEFAANGRVKCQVEVKTIKDLNSVMASLGVGELHGRIVIDITKGF